MKTESKFLKVLFYIGCSVFALAVLIFLFKWTDHIERNQKPDYLTSVFFSQEELVGFNVFEKCSPSVVHINIQPDNGIGSGFFISEDGYICTNEHVIEGFTEILVTTYDEKVYQAELIGEDHENDIALLKINPEKNEKFPYLEFETSSELLVGQTVYAIGNPFGFDRTLSIGNIAGLSRPIRNSNGEVLLGMIQTDASINPGNSGGPLLNRSGKVIGVCAAVYSNEKALNGMNFAVSSDDAQASIKDLKKYGQVRRGWLDIVPVVLSPQIVEYSSLKVDKGILVSSVVSGGKAEEAGLKGGKSLVKYGTESLIYVGGDVITSVNGVEVSDFSDLFTALSKTRPEDKVDVIINRNGSSVRIKVQLVERTTELVNLLVK